MASATCWTTPGGTPWISSTYCRAAAARRHRRPPRRCLPVRNRRLPVHRRHRLLPLHRRHLPVCRPAHRRPRHPASCADGPDIAAGAGRRACVMCAPGGEARHGLHVVHLDLAWFRFTLHALSLGRPNCVRRPIASSWLQPPFIRWCARHHPRVGPRPEWRCARASVAYGFVSRAFLDA